MAPSSLDPACPRHNGGLTSAIVVLINVTSYHLSLSLLPGSWLRYHLGAPHFHCLSSWLWYLDIRTLSLSKFPKWIEHTRPFLSVFSMQTCTWTCGLWPHGNTRSNKCIVQGDWFRCTRRPLETFNLNDERLAQTHTRSRYYHYNVRECGWNVCTKPRS